MVRSEPETCTVELTTGSFIQLACQPRAVLMRQAKAIADQSSADAERLRGDVQRDPREPLGWLQEFQRVTGHATKWEQVWIDVRQIVAVYPIHARPEPAMVYSVLAAGGMVPQGA